MFLENYLNRSETDVYWPLFECIYASEVGEYPESF